MKQLSTAISVIVTAALGAVSFAQGVPEPGIVLYGKVWHEGVVATSGNLTWTYTSLDGTVSVEITAPLQTIEAPDGDIFSYRVAVPAESPLAGAALSADALPATVTTMSYQRTAVIDGETAVIAGDATTDTFSLAERGKVARLDLAKAGSVIPASAISGTVEYSGRQPGDRVVQIFDNPAFTGAPVYAVTMPDTGANAFDAENLLSGSYYLRGFKDQNGDGLPQSVEAHAEFSGNPIAVPPDASGLTLTLLDADVDDDGLPDWWELAQLNTLASTAEADFDGDGENNGLEYVNNTDAADARSTQDPVNAYQDFEFSIWRGASTNAVGSLSEDRWGIDLVCALPEDVTILSGALVKPAASAGDNPVDLDVDNESDTTFWTSATYASLAEMAADAVPGLYYIHVVTEGEGRARQDLRFVVEVPAYDALSFPDYVKILEPVAGATDVPTEPYLLFSGNEWDTLWIREQPDDTLVYRYAQTPGTESSHQVAAGVLNGGEIHTLYLRTDETPDDRFASVSRVSFTTEPDPGECMVTFAADANGMLTGDLAQTVMTGADCNAVIAHADPGYGFVEWTVGGLAFSTDNPLIVTNVTTNMEVRAAFEIACHDADQNQDWMIQIAPELTRVIQFFNSAGYQCATDTEDGFAPGTSPVVNGPYHDVDQSRDWQIQLSPEITRLIQFYNSGGYHSEPGTEDGYAPGLTQRKSSPTPGQLVAKWSAQTVEGEDNRVVAVDLWLSHGSPRALRSLAVFGVLPSEWQYAGVLHGPEPDIAPLPGEQNQVQLAWIGIPETWPLKVTLLLQSPERSSVPSKLTGAVNYRESAGEISVKLPDLAISK